MSSASSVVAISRSKKRYTDQDNLLFGFIGHDGFTAKEVATEVLHWGSEQYCNAPKRVLDLERLEYLEVLPARVCRKTGKVAKTYKITLKGQNHLRAQGFSIDKKVCRVVPDVDVVLPVVDKRVAIKDLMRML
ncbi:MAG: hypothetical protein H7836_11210 [Magnetococcus sp. YQC-3]